MSGLGQKRTWRDQIAMSALLPIADIRPRDRDVCFGPIADLLPTSPQWPYCNKKDRSTYLAREAYRPIGLVFRHVA